MSVSGEQVSKQLNSSFPSSDFWVVIFVKYQVPFILLDSYKCFWFLLKFGSTVFIYTVGKGGHTPCFPDQVSPFSKISPFLEIQDVPTFHRPIKKTKVLNDSFNRFVYKFYQQNILILEGYLLKWWNGNLINTFKCFLVNFMKNGCQLEKGI